jgi:hypothetical protein
MAAGITDSTNTQSCGALKKVKEIAAGTKHSSEFNTMLLTCKPE